MLRKLFIVSMLLVLPLGAALADGTDTFVELLRSDLRADKKELVSLALDLSGEDSAVFWPIYKEFEAKRTVLGDRMIDLIKRYPDAVDLTGPETLRPLATEWFKIQEDRNKLMKKYYNKIQKQVSLRVGVSWMQIEHRLSLLINLQIASVVPIVEPIGR